MSVPVSFMGERSAAGHCFATPLPVAEQTRTVFVGRDDLLEVDAADNFVTRLWENG